VIPTLAMAGSAGLGWRSVLKSRQGPGPLYALEEIVSWNIYLELGHQNNSIIAPGQTAEQVLNVTIIWPIFLFEM
jgi:hypothetical protein